MANVSMNWGSLTLGSVIGFGIGWIFLGFWGAVILAIAACLLLGILKV